MEQKCAAAPPPIARNLPASIFQPVFASRPSVDSAPARTRRSLQREGTGRGGCAVTRRGATPHPVAGRARVSYPCPRCLQSRPWAVCRRRRALRAERSEERRVGKEYRLRVLYDVIKKEEKIKSSSININTTE